MNWVAGAGAAVVGGGGVDGGGVDAGVEVLGAGTDREDGALAVGASEDDREGLPGFRADTVAGADDAADGPVEDGDPEDGDPDDDPTEDIDRDDGAAGDGAAAVAPSVIDAGPTAGAVTPAEVAVSGRLSAARVRLTP